MCNATEKGVEMVKIKEVIINELYTGKNYFVLDNGIKFDVGQSNGDVFQEIFGTDAYDLQQNFPNVQHNIKGLNVSPLYTYPSHILAGAVVMDTAPLFNTVKNFQINSNVDIDEDLGVALVSYNGLTAEFDLVSDAL